MSELPDRPSWYYRQSAVIPYRQAERGLEVLLITSRRRKRWIIPKGIVEPDLTPAESAVKEAFEEAGVVGEVSTSSVGTYQYKKWNGTCTVEVFSLQVKEVLKAWPEVQERTRAWLSPEEAANRVAEPALKELLRSLAR